MNDKEKHGQALCPYDPQHNSTAVFVGKFVTRIVCCGIAEQMSVLDYLMFIEPCIIVVAEE